VPVNKHNKIGACNIIFCDVISPVNKHKALGRQPWLILCTYTSIWQTKIKIFKEWSLLQKIKKQGKIFWQDKSLIPSFDKHS